MKALEFIKKYAKENPGAIAGSYCLNRLFGTEYADIDYFTPLLKDALDEREKYVTNHIEVKDRITVLGKEFKMSGTNYPAKFNFVSYKCEDFDDVPVNLVMVVQTEKYFSVQIQDILNGFDLDILRVWMDARDNFESVNTTKYHEDCVLIKKIPVIKRLAKYAVWHDDTRIEKYKKRFPEYKFVKIDNEVEL